MSAIAPFLLLAFLWLALLPTGDARPRRPASGHLLKDFDKSESLTFMTFSSIAYCDSSTIEGWNCSDCGNTYTPGFKYFGQAYDSGTQTFGYVGVQSLGSSSRVVISFRGTSNLPNWLTDLEATKTSPYEGVPDAAVHYGFYTASQKLESQVMDAVASAMAAGGVDSIYVTGHSLGAALSVLTAVSVKGKYPDTPVAIYNFGLPRVGNQAFAQFFESLNIPVFRVVNFDDIVPHVPPQSMGFYHVDTEVWVHNTTSDNCTVPVGTSTVGRVGDDEECYSTCNGSGEDGSCSDSVSPFSLSIPDHLSYPPYNGPGQSTSCHVAAFRNEREEMHMLRKLV